MDTQAVKELKSLKERISEINQQLTDLKRAKVNIEQELISEMNLEGLSLARTDFGTVSVTKTDVASVKDWPAFEEYVYENRALYLLQRRPADVAYREEIAAKGSIPGVETFTKVNLSLTNKAT
jgi:hypothetical protein